MEPVYFIVNRTSGTGQSAGAWRTVSAYLKKQGIVFHAYETKYKGHAQSLARRLSVLPRPQVNLIVVGGDGTVNEVLNGIVDFEKVHMGVIPAGSGNDFSGGTGMKGSVQERLKHILSQIETGTYQELDLGEVEAPGMEKPRKFGISSGLGLDAAVCKKALDSPLKKVLNRLHAGNLIYLLLTVAELFSMDTIPYRIAYCKEESLEGDRLIKTCNCERLIFLAAMNLPAEGGGVPMAPEASCRDGKLSFSTASDIPKWKTFFYLPLLAMAKQEHIRGFEITDAYEASVYLKKPAVLHADGEYCGDVREAKFRCLKGKLKLLW